MKILLTGATGYIGKRLLPVLISKGYKVVCSVRDKNKFNADNFIKEGEIEVIENDLTDKHTLNNIPSDLDIAFYLVHSMSTSRDYGELEQRSAINFRESLQHTNVKQVIYLSGIVNAEKLSKHLSSRKTVEMELRKGNFALTTIRAGIIIGSGSASFEIIRDLVEKLPVMVAPKWLNTKCQPVGISDVIKVMTGVINLEETFDQSYDIYGKDTLTYKQMLLQFAEERGLKRFIRTVPVMTPRLSSYWLYFITSTSYKLATALVDSMKVEAIATGNNLYEILQLKPLSYRASIQRAFKKIEQNEILSSWKDSTVSGRINYKISEFMTVPTFGCYVDKRIKQMDDADASLEKIWRIGGETGWYYATWLWKIRGFLDKLAGGVGLRRGRTNVDDINSGDALDFWRVLYADKSEGRLLLFAEMKLPGEAWLEFRMEGNELIQTATFRPKGLTGRLYWIGIYPLHASIFEGLIKKLAYKK
ncbi:MAG: SDR family oxidoreductase [Bacteroidales bacterium]|nr:SDR family oxidoreductase [Bacteroidales bacterium]